MSKVKVFLFGSTGKMGLEIAKILQSQPHNFVLTGEAHQDKPVNQEALRSANVAIDFTVASAFSDVLEQCLQSKVALVSGTTGLSDLQKQKLKEASLQIPVLWSPNMSLGVAVFKKLLSHVKMLSDTDIALTEYHHKHKKDAPSGTAKLLHESIQKTLPQKNVDIHSIRGGGIFGIHRVEFMGEEEILRIEHEALSRTVFARGAVRVALWLAQKKAGLYSMDDLLESEV